MSAATRTCPRCAEPIKPAAEICPHCRSDLTGVRELLNYIGVGLVLLAVIALGMSG